MGKDYADPRFGVQQSYVTDLTGALNGTVGATELFRYIHKKAATIDDIGVRFKAGGTAATRQIIIGTATSGGAMTAIGTAVLGTQATNTTKLLGISGAIAAGEELVFQHLGTDAIVYNIEFQPFYTEKFVDA